MRGILSAGCPGESIRGCAGCVGVGDSVEKVIMVTSLLIFIEISRGKLHSGGVVDPHGLDTHMQEGS